MSIENNVVKNSLRGKMSVAGGMLLIASSPAYAHHAMGGTTPDTLVQGLISGLAHPVIGLDHFAFLVVAILLSCALKGAARYIVPLAFVGATVGGTALHLGAANIPMSEMLVAVTVVVGAVLALTRNYLGAVVLSSIFAVSGILHGYAYGESIIGAEMTPLVSYLVGFAAIQYLIIAGGTLGLEKLTKHSEAMRNIAARVSGIAALLTGGLFLAMSLS